MIKTEFGFFQISVKFGFGNALELGQSAFGKAPKGFHLINMAIAIGEFIMAVIHAVMFVITNNDKSIIAAPSIAVDDAFKTLIKMEGLDY